MNDEDDARPDDDEPDGPSVEESTQDDTRPGGSHRPYAFSRT